MIGFLCLSLSQMSEIGAMDEIDFSKVMAATSDVLFGQEPNDFASHSSRLRQYRMHLRDQSFGIKAQTSELNIQMRTVIGGTDSNSHDEALAMAPRALTNKKVSIIMPSRGDVKIVWGKSRCLPEAAIRSILDVTNYSDFEIILVLDEPHVAPPSLLEICQDNQVKVLNFTKPFNFSEKCNEGFLVATGEIILLLNDDIEIIDPEWLNTLVNLLEDQSVGMVGPLLLLEDGRIQSAGHGMSPTPHNLLAGASLGDPQLRKLLSTTRNTSGVTAACVAIRADLYEEMGGMTLDLPIDFNDVDFGLKLLESGYRILWTPETRVYHFESLTREVTLGPNDEHHLRRRWARYFVNDPYASEFYELLQHTP